MLRAPEGGERASGARVDLQGSLRIDLPALREHVSGLLPEGLELGPQARAAVTDMTVRGTMDDLVAACAVALDGGVGWGGLALEDLRGNARLDEEALALDGFTASLNGGRVSATRAMVGLGGEAPPFALEVELADAAVTYELTRLLAYVLPFLSLDDRQAEIGGKLTAGLRLEGRGFDLASLEESLAGSGRVRIVEGRVRASRFFQQLGGILGTSLDRVLFSEMGSDFQVGGGKIVGRDVFLQGAEGAKVRRLGLEGTTWLDGRLDYGVNLSVLRQSIGDDKIQEVLGAVERVLGDGALPLRLRGTLSSPDLALALESVPAPGIDRLLETIPGIGGGGARRPPAGGDEERSGGSPDTRGRRPGELRIEDLIEEVLGGRRERR